MSEIEQRHEGEWHEPVHSGYLMACCDCGLVHSVDFKVRGILRRQVQMRAFRDEKATSQERHTYPMKVCRLKSAWQARIHPDNDAWDDWVSDSGLVGPEGWMERPDDELDVFGEELPTLPPEVAEKGFEGLQDGIDKATDPKKH